MLPAIYGFDSEVPVRIFAGELKIDFRKVEEVLGQIRM